MAWTRSCFAAELIDAGEMLDVVLVGIAGNDFPRLSICRHLLEGGGIFKLIIIECLELCQDVSKGLLFHPPGLEQ